MEGSTTFGAAGAGVALCVDDESTCSAAGASTFVFNARAYCAKNSLSVREDFVAPGFLAQ
jgi:hypothetical protein